MWNTTHYYLFNCSLILLTELQALSDHCQPAAHTPREHLLSALPEYSAELSVLALHQDIDVGTVVLLRTY